MTPGGQAQIGNVDLVKQLNSAAVYRLIDQYGPISRIQIAEQSQLAPASVTKITRQLIERGLIKEVDQQASTGGRRAISIVTETRNFHAIGVRLGRHDATITLFDLSSKVLAEEHYPLPERTQQTLEHALLNAIAQFIDSYQRKLRELIAISVILPGLVDPDSGKIHYMPHIQVENWGLVEALEEPNHTKMILDIWNWKAALTLVGEKCTGSSTGKTFIMIIMINRVASSVIHLKIPTVFTWVTPDLISTCMRMAPTVLRIV